MLEDIIGHSVTGGRKQGGEGNSNEVAGITGILMLFQDRGGLLSPSVSLSQLAGRAWEG